jgi:anti-anti-sigma factor
MTAANVAVHTDRTPIRIVIAGEIDMDNAAAVEEQIFIAVDNRATAVQVDLTDLSYLDSSGLRILFTLANRLQMLQIELEVLAPPGSPARQVLELAGFDAILPLRP